MPRIRPLDPADAEGSNREIFEIYLKERGVVPNLMRTLAHRPEHLRTMAIHLRIVMRSGTVPVRLKELLAVRVSRINACEYGVASHTALARQVGATDAQIEALMDLSGSGAAAVAGFPADCLGTAPTEPPPEAGSPSLFSRAECAAIRFSEQMTLGAGRVDEATFLAAREHFDQGQIVEIAAVVGMFNYIDRFTNALEIEVTR